MAEPQGRPLERITYGDNGKPKLTPKERKFAINVAIHEMNYLEAHRDAYDPETKNYDSLRSMASAVANREDVREEIELLRKLELEKLGYTRKKHFEELETERMDAKDKGDTRSSLRATELKGKTMGIYDDSSKLQAVIGDMTINIQKKLD